MAHGKQNTIISLNMKLHSIELPHNTTCHKRNIHVTEFEYEPTDL